MAEGKEQVICQAELLAIPVAFRTWEGHLAGRDVVVFIDNEPAKDALIHGISSSLQSSLLVRYTRILCARAAVGAWYERVASPSNIADDPSRGKFTALLAAGAIEVQPVDPEVGAPANFTPF